MKRSTVYAMVAETDFFVGELSVSNGAIVYVGKTVQKFKYRDHTLKKTSSCTLRRSLACSLRDELDLTPILPKTNVNEKVFGLSLADEAKVSRWIKENLGVLKIAVSAKLSDVEKALIEYYRPPFNIEGWANPRAEGLRELRRKFHDEAIAST